MAETVMKVRVPLERVEGDLEVHAEIRDGVVVDARAAGTSFRGIERILADRAPLDALVVTPRVCGVCSTAHLNAAALALEGLAGITPPPDAVRVRNVALAMEVLNSDLRHAFLLFAVDFTRPAYRDGAAAVAALHPEAVRRYRAYEGESVVAAVRAVRRLVEVIATLGGQWPHSAYMVPGGVTSLPGENERLRCRLAIDAHRRWFEGHVLGCSIERWLEVDSADALASWLDENPAHRDGELGFFLRFARAAGLDRHGGGHDSWLSVGAFPDPERPPTKADRSAGLLVPAGVLGGGATSPFEPARLAEDVSHSYYADRSATRHPSDGRTVPLTEFGDDDERYSWAKAPRYDERPCETGPLAERLIAADPLFTDLVARGGATTLVRQFARIVRHAWLLPAAQRWIAELGTGGGFYAPPGDLPDGTAFGLTEATRGALGHWVRVENGVIANYQVVSPTTWNASPRDERDVRGPIEEALVGTPVADPEDPVELGHVVRSFDPCLVCTVHAVRAGRVVGQARSGAAT